MPVATILNGGFALNNNVPGQGGPNKFLPLMGVGLLRVLALIGGLIRG